MTVVNDVCSTIAQNVSPISIYLTSSLGMSLDCLDYFLVLYCSQLLDLLLVF